MTMLFGTLGASLVCREALPIEALLKQMESNMTRRKRLFTSLVTLRPAKETSGTVTDAAKQQEISSMKPLLVVPQDDSETAERINTLRLFDAALTPADMAGSYGIPPWALDTARLIRARYHAKRAGMLPEIKTPDLDSYYQACAASLPNVQNSANINRQAILHGLPDSYESEALETWESAIDFATQLAEQSEQRGEPQPKGGQGEPSEGEGEGEGEDMPQPQPGDFSGDSKRKIPAPGKYRAPDELPKGPPAKPQPVDLFTGRPMPEDKLEDSDPWHIGTTPPPQRGRNQTGHCQNFDKPDVLKMNPRKRKKGTRRRSAPEGAALGRVARLLLDGKIFKKGVVRGGYRGRGAIMVDLSGSMGWTEADVGALLDVLPESSIYGYCGNSGHGRLVLLADRGKTVDLKALTQWKRNQGGGNEIDDSALRFLCRQAAPRIWISDAGVCASGCDTSYMYRKCNEAIAAGRIIRVNNGREAAKILLGR